ncbi:Clavaminate synthase-like protein [Aspergillus campestris IBT 28561]|uniref:Clavaminate synthase-like protein n=1 Tax=Aspergillus campestris (strain IBT 28561) TaxID=1392248 RepID=A0A2I1D5K9_ASPC2|nr:Clavaminate synthase-like protein [Aspergillus campestris IBT 28561]PKY05143.1 Clavaminate synthase-like protein [Aspergillus campestris IBT 28561]
MLNATYPHRGVFKTAARHNKSSDQKFTIDLSSNRASLIPPPLHESIATHGLDSILTFFNTLRADYVPSILSCLGLVAGTDLAAAHQDGNLNFRLCDYNPDTADPECSNGCGAHTDYGTFSIIFQDGTAGLELEDADAPGTWHPVPGDATVFLTGWCAVVLSGGRIRAARHRVRRTPGVRRLSAVLFVAPDLDAKLRPLEGVQAVWPFSEYIKEGNVDVRSFKEVMGQRWRYREGNEKLDDNDAEFTQDSVIEKLIWG